MHWFWKCFGFENALFFETAFSFEYISLLSVHCFWSNIVFEHSSFYEHTSFLKIHCFFFKYIVLFKLIVFWACNFFEHATFSNMHRFWKCIVCFKCIVFWACNVSSVVFVRASFSENEPVLNSHALFTTPGSHDILKLEDLFNSRERFYRATQCRMNAANARATSLRGIHRA